MDGANLELRYAGVAFDALHLAPRLAAGGSGVSDSDSESTSSDSSGADSSGDSSDEDEAGGLDLLRPPPPGKGTDHPSARPGCGLSNELSSLLNQTQAVPILTVILALLTSLQHFQQRRPRPIKVT